MMAITSREEQHGQVVRGGRTDTHKSPTNLPGPEVDDIRRQLEDSDDDYINAYINGKGRLLDPLE